MGGKDANYQVVYRGEALENYRPGGWVFFQRPKECGGGYWLGRTYDEVYMMDFWRPVSLSEGLDYLMTVTGVEAKSDEFDVNFPLF